MLTFLRTFRKSLIESLPTKASSKEGGAARKYILYAIGEVLLVMIGILLALQVNNWNKWKKERIKEKEILGSLVNNFELNIQTLETDIENLYNLNHSAKITITVLDEKLSYVDSLGYHFHLARIPKAQLSISQSGYEQYKNIGYDIITNDTLKQEVINYFESTFPKWWTNYLEVNYKNKCFMIIMFHFSTIRTRALNLLILSRYTQINIL